MFGISSLPNQTIHTPLSFVLLILIFVLKVAKEIKKKIKENGD